MNNKPSTWTTQRERWSTEQFEQVKVDLKEALKLIPHELEPAAHNTPWPFRGKAKQFEEAFIK